MWSASLRVLLTYYWYLIIYSLSSSHQGTVLLGWCKSNCNFCIVEICLWYWNTFLSKCGYGIHHFNEHFSLDDFFFPSDLSLHFICILWQSKISEEWDRLKVRVAANRSHIVTIENRTESIASFSALNTTNASVWFKVNGRWERKMILCKGPASSSSPWSSGREDCSGASFL